MIHRRILLASFAAAGALLAVPAAPQVPSPSEQRVQLPDSTGRGPFPAMKEELASLPDHVVYRPKDMSAVGTRKLPLYIFGNGACSSDGASARQHLLEIASHGYLAIASGRIKSSPGITPPDRADAYFDQTATHQVLDAIDWAKAENARKGSPFYHHLDPKRVAVSGHSCGGLQAIEAAADPRVTTLIVMNSGIYNGGPNGRSSVKLEKSRLRDLHGSALYVLGGPRDIAYANGMDDFRRIEKIPVVAANLPVGHGGTFAQPNGGSAAALVVKWLDYRLKGDREAGRWFDGTCATCTPGWIIDRRN